MCNQSLMKLVTPEDDEPDEPKPTVQRQTEPNPEDSLAKQEGTASGEWTAPHPSPSTEGSGDDLQRSWDLPSASLKSGNSFNSDNSPIK